MVLEEEVEAETRGEEEKLGALGSWLAAAGPSGPGAVAFGRASSCGEGPALPAGSEASSAGQGGRESWTWPS